METSLPVLIAHDSNIVFPMLSKLKLARDEIMSLAGYNILAGEYQNFDAILTQLSAEQIRQGRTLTLNFHDIDYLYRVSFDPFQPNRLLISGQYPNGEIFSWTYKPGLKQLKSVLADGVAAYKCALYNGDCYYAERIEGFEDRRIRKAKSLETTDLPAGKYISETEEFTDNHGTPEFE